MTDFNDLELAKAPSEMEPDEARETLAEFMESHKQNREVHDELRTDFAEAKDEYENEIEEREETIAEFRQDRAEDAAEFINMPADLISSRFSLPEIEQIIEEAEGSAEFSEDESPEDEDEDRLTTFSQKEEKGRRESEDTTPTQFSKDPQERLHEKWGFQ